MLEKHMASWLVAAVCMATPALAQTPAPPPSGPTDRPLATGSGSTASGSPAMQPGSTGSSPEGTGMSPPTSAAPAAKSGPPTDAAPNPPMRGPDQPDTQNRFITQLDDDQLQASKLIGTTVISANNEAIGDVNDVVIDRNGRALAIVIGVGGFLGIGEKDVAVRLSALEFTASPRGGRSGSSENQQASTNAAVGGERSAKETTHSSVGTTGAASRQQNTATDRATATTGNTGNSGPNTGSGAKGWMGLGSRGAPERIVLRMSKSELESAPAFRTRFRDVDGAADGAPAPKQ